MIKRCKGFSLLELILVMVILGILSAYASSKLNLASHDASGYAEIIKSSIRLAQKLAIAKRTTNTVAVTFPVNPCSGAVVNGVQVTGQQCDALPNGVSVSVIVNGINSTSFNISFEGLGRPIPNAAATITVSGGDVTRTIYLEAETGYVHE